jgi:hypothetical protein
MQRVVPWLLLVATLPTSQATERMRLWRSLKSSGAATLKDGVYLLPHTEATQHAFRTLADDAVAAGGEAWLVQADSFTEAEGRAWLKLFDRSEEYRALIAEVQTTDVRAWPSSQGTRRLQALWRRHAQIVQADHLANPLQQQSQAALDALELAWKRLNSPDEPQATKAAVQRLDRQAYVGRTWATRKRPWVDRLASAWLICRYIDPEARFKWLKTPADCKASWLGFDFDGATFTHVESFVTFETLMHSFGLEGDASLARVAELVHYMDVGGAAVPQAPGLEVALTGMRNHLQNDDQLLDAACAVFDSLRSAFEQAIAEGKA